MKKFFVLVKNSIQIMWRRHHFLIPPKYFKKYVASFFRKVKRLKNPKFLNPIDKNEYQMYLKSVKEEEIDLNLLKYKPLISIVIPVYNIEEEYLTECINSILENTYQNFEICLADDCSTKKETIELLKRLSKLDKRIKVVYRKENGHISKCTNSALDLATGEYIALMDDDDLLSKNALYEVVLAINKDKTIDFIYTDEDKMDMNGDYLEPHYKSDFALDSFFGGNYICHFTVLRKDIFEKIGNFNSEYNGAQDFDLFLRASEVANNIHHISKVLYHWRKIPGSTADTIDNKEYAILSGKKAVMAALKRRNLDGDVYFPIKSTQYLVKYNHNNPLVSVIFINCNERCLKNNINEFISNSNYNNFEFLTSSKNKVKNNIKNIKYIDTNNINDIIKNSSGELILIVSGYIKFKKSDCMDYMVSYAIQKDIGVVGPKIYNFDTTIKSAGMVLNKETIFKDAYRNYFIDSIGLYGRLLVPYNYSAISYHFMMFSKDKFTNYCKFDPSMNINMSSIDFCLSLLKNNKRNVLLGNTYIYQKDIYEEKFNECDMEKLRNKYDLDNDVYYNNNLSKKYLFMLDRK